MAPDLRRRSVRWNSLTVCRTEPVGGLAETAAPVTAAPLGSVTIPWMEPVFCCAARCAARENAEIKTHRHRSETRIGINLLERMRAALSMRQIVALTSSWAVPDIR